MHKQFQPAFMLLELIIALAFFTLFLGVALHFHTDCLRIRHQAYEQFEAIEKRYSHEKNSRVSAC